MQRVSTGNVLRLQATTNKDDKPSNHTSPNTQSLQWLFTVAMKSALSSLLLLLAASLPVHAASDKPLKPCTVVSPTTERFFDLNGLRRTLPKEGDKKKDGDEGSWHAKGYDYGANFTVNFCGPVVEELSDVQDLDKKLWRNVSAFYEKGDRQYAIG